MNDLGFDPLNGLGLDPSAPVIGDRPAHVETRADQVARVVNLRQRVEREIAQATGGDERLRLVLMAMSAHERGLVCAEFVVSCMRSAFKLPTPAIPSWEEFGQAEIALYQGSCRDTASASEAGG